MDGAGAAMTMPSRARVEGDVGVTSGVDTDVWTPVSSSEHNVEHLVGAAMSSLMSAKGFSEETFNYSPGPGMAVDAPLERRDTTMT